jgi:tetratricopeptide (TPR) repeat protein
VQGYDQDGLPNAAQQQELHRRLAPMLKDSIRLVRTEAAKILTRIPITQFTDVERREFEAALAELRTGMQAVNDDAGPHMVEGTIYFNQGRLPQAREEFKLAIRLARNQLQAGQARMQLATIEHESQNNADAERLFREVIALEPRYPDAHYQLGLLLAETESRLAEAAVELGQAAKLAPTNSRWQYNYGLASQQLGRTGDAEMALLQACQLEPRNADYLYALALLYFELQDWKNAQVWAERLVQVDPNQQYQQFLRAVMQRGARP